MSVGVVPSVGADREEKSAEPERAEEGPVPAVSPEGYGKGIERAASINASIWRLS